MSQPESRVAAVRPGTSSFQGHGMVARMEIQGYDLCRCGDLHPIIALSRSAGTCPKCEHEVFDRVKLMEVRVGRRRELVRLLPRRRNRGEPSENARLARAASAAAMRRVKNLFPEVYAIVYAEERAKRGLESFPIEGRALTASQVDQALEELESEHGILER